LLGMAILLSSIVLMGYFTSLPAFIIFSILAGFGGGILGPAQQAAVADVIGAGRNGGKALAGFQMATDLGAIIGPLIAGLMADHISYQVALSASGAVCLVGVVTWLFTPTTIK